MNRDCQGHHTMDTDSQPNIYQVAGVDDLERGFNRQAEMRNHDGHFQAIFRYEKFQLEAERQTTEPAALANLVSQLQERGYTQLRTRLHFRGNHYLGNQEIWNEHEDLKSRNLFYQLKKFMARWWTLTRH